MRRFGQRTIWKAHHAYIAGRTPQIVRLFNDEAPKKEITFNPPIHRLIYREAASLEKTFDVLESRVAPFDSKGCDTFYHKCLEESLDTALFHRVIKYFDRFLHEDETGPSNGTMSSVVALLIKHGHVELAEQYLEKRRENFPTSTMHFRAYAPLLEHYINTCDFNRAWAFWTTIKQSGVYLDKETVGPVLVSFALATSKDGKMFKYVLQSLAELRYQLSIADRDSWLKQNNSAWTVSQVKEHDMLPACSSCGHALEKLPIQSDEYNQLCQAIKLMCMAKPSSLAKWTPEAKTVILNQFEAWLDRQHAKVRPGKLHYIIDGPNVAYMNQNYEGGAFRFDYIDKVVQNLESQGHVVSVTLPAIYFDEVSILSVKATTATRRLRKEGVVFKRTRTEADKKFLDKWQGQDIAFKCHREVASDDLFWMYGCSYLVSLHGSANVRVVTNDILRDHIFVLTDEMNIQRDLIDRWKDLTVVGLHILDKNTKANERSGGNDGITLEFLDPPRYSRVIQGDQDGHHLPIAGLSEWLCLHR
ncbi:unnamed protein product [Aphanomyces euteiches]|uniref:Uncharacterized protein n=1 Tax=Aphanomyces euteiches TaxID=100861 RepID=A0A6G0WCG0_9STRA|nr:hypothetical protein Ae201684_016990 [Aphanomyces euteiches]KAH9073898.1 hypothetical protein Ae201684P_003397 [Aphanomyces euteiches]KAH9158043.1 hypothetical protein AeRB84_000178 [Aphanomyces euteiches]